MKISEFVSLGSLDACAGGILRGWFLSDDEDAINKVRLRVNGEILEHEPEREDRSDVVEIHGGHLSCGFKFDLSQIDFPPIAQIGVIHIDSDYDFNSSIYNYYGIKEKYLDTLKALVLPEYNRSTYTLFELDDEKIIDHYLTKGCLLYTSPSPRDRG